MPPQKAMNYCFLFSLFIRAGLLDAAPGEVPSVQPAKTGMHAERLAVIDEIVAEGIRRGNMPGCVVIIGHKGKIVFHKAYGHRQIQPVKQAMTIDTLFDLASLTKPIATAACVMNLVEGGKIGLDVPVARYLPGFAASGKQKITVRQLLVHQSGLIPDNSLKDYMDGPSEAISRIYRLKPFVTPGKKFVYSDVGFIVLGKLVEKISGKNVHEFSQQVFFRPLGMIETGYLPKKELRKRAATTERRAGKWIKGEVHDPRAYQLGGIAGHAGLFSTAKDLARFAQMLLNGGEYDGVRVLKPETVGLMTKPIKVSSGLRGLGWDIRTGYSSNRGDLMSKRAFGHGGFTGTSFWVDPGNNLFVIFLSNRVHPDGKGSVNSIAGRIGTIAAAAIQVDSANRSSRLSEAFSFASLSRENAESNNRQPVVLTPRALKLHRSCLVIDGHNDLPWTIRTKAGSSFQQADIAKPLKKFHTDIPRLKTGGVGAQFWSVYAPVETRRQKQAAHYVMEQIDLVNRMVKRYPETFELAYSTEDIRRIRRSGKIASLIGMEGGHAIENSLALLRMFYRMGARYMTLTHSDTLDWADSATDTAKHAGLSKFGEEVVLKMNELGMLVDISHVSAETMVDALKVSKSPIIASHSSAFAIAGHPRNVPDHVLKLMKANGGVIMVNYYSGYVVPESAKTMLEMFNIRRELRKKHTDNAAFNKAYQKWKTENPIQPGTIHDVIDHIDHIVKVAGIDHVGLGSDYDGVSKLPEQLHDVSTYPYITQALLDRGYSAEQIRKILGENLMRAFKQAEQISKNWNNTNR